MYVCEYVYPQLSQQLKRNRKQDYGLGWVGGGAGHRGQNTTISRIQAWGVRLNLRHHGVCTQLKGGTVPGPILPSLLEVITPPRNGNSGFLPI